MSFARAGVFSVIGLVSADGVSLLGPPTLCESIEASGTDVCVEVAESFGVLSEITASCENVISCSVCVHAPLA